MFNILLQLLFYSILYIFCHRLFFINKLYFKFSGLSGVTI